MTDKFVQPAIPRFDGHYDHWSMMMENFMRSKELWSLVEEGIPVSTIRTVPTSEAQRRNVEEAKLKDLKVKNFLFQAIDREILETILDKGTSNATKNSIEVIFFLRTKESNDLSALTIDELHGSLLVHEQRMHEPQVEEQVLKVTHDDRFGRGRGGRAFSRGGRGRGGRAFSRGGRGRGQWEEKANYVKMEEEAEEEELLLMSHMDLHQVTKEEVWFLDSGCSNHMTGNKGWFSNLEEGFCQTVKLGNDMKMNVVAKGNVRMQVNGVTQVISDVYFVPELKNNLLSLGQLQEKGLAILIQNGTCKVFHSIKGLIMQTKMSGNKMFYVSATAVSKETMCLQTELEK
ncbi:uncharacterized protein [Cicer arietinum]|uniref:uncharacterized protein n=1 Tax=Cicer arietinum TaxID=3827 RepID=UPI003CC6AA84